MRVSGGFASEEDVRRVNFVSNGRLIRLSDISTVKRTYADPPQPMFRVKGQPAIALGISMREGGNVVALGGSIKEAIASITGDLPVGIEPVLVADQPAVVSDAVDDFMRSLVEALIIVIAIGFLGLGLRAGAVVALSIPVVLAVVFVFMDFHNIALQRVSLGALIISLGLLVDDAMITVEMMVRKLEEGWTKSRAATYAYMTTHFPMGTGTLVTVAAFLPIGMTKSAVGEFLYSLFAVVAVALIASWFVAAIFTPLFGVVLLSEKVKHRARREPGRAMRVFREILVLAMRWRRTTVALAVAAFVLAMVGLSFVPRQYFPSANRLELFVDLKLPQNASIAATEKAASELDRLLLDDPDIDRWSTYVGQGAVRFYLPMLVELRNNFFAQAVVLTKSLDARERVRARIERAFEDKFPEVVGRAYPLEMGMPVGWPVQYRVSGPDTGEVRKIAYRLASVMAESPELRNLNFDWIETSKTLQIRVDQDQARLLNLSSASLAQALDTVISGTTITQIRDGIHLIDLVVRGQEQERVSLDSLETLQIPLPNGRTVPLVHVASIQYGQELPLIRRRDRVPTLTVLADVRSGIQPETAVEQSPFQDRCARCDLACGLQNRARRSGGRKCKGPKVAHGRAAFHGDFAAHDIDGSVAQRPPSASGAQRCAARNDRGGDRTSCFWQAARLCGNRRRDRFGRHGCAQLRRPDGPDRRGDCPGAHAMGRRRRGDTASIPSHPSDRFGSCFGHDTDRDHGVLGTICHWCDRRIDRGDDPDPPVPACTVCSLVPRKRAAAAGRQSSARLSRQGPRIPTIAANA